MAYLEQSLVIESEREDDGIGLRYCTMGDLLVVQEGREKETLLMVFQTFIGLFEEGNTSEELIRVLVKLGKAFTKIRAWDDAIASLEKGYRLQTPLKMKNVAIH